MIEFIPLNKNSLLEYIHSENFGKGNDIPITIHRALSHSRNPRLEEEDVILLLAMEHDILVGYLGILPDSIFLKNRVEKMGWLSCLWVSEQARGKGISIRLITKSLALWNNKILSADYVPFTKMVYDKTKQFHDTPFTKNGLRLYIKSDLQTILPPKKKIFTKTKWLLAIFDFFLNLLLNIRLYFFKKEVPKLQFEYVNQIDDEINDFISTKQENEFFKRKKEELNWIIKNPWILSAPQKDSLNQKYYFSSTAKSFEYHCVKIKNTSNQLIAFMIFTNRNNTLKVPYIYHDNCLDVVVKTLNYHLIHWEIKTFTTYHSELIQALKNSKTPAIFKKEIKRNYMVSNLLKDEIMDSDMEIQDGDGDCCFT